MGTRKVLAGMQRQWVREAAVALAVDAVHNWQHFEMYPGELGDLGRVYPMIRKAGYADHAQDALDWIDSYSPEWIMLGNEPGDPGQSHFEGDPEGAADWMAEQVRLIRQRSWSIKIALGGFSWHQIAIEGRMPPSQYVESFFHHLAATGFGSDFEIGAIAINVHPYVKEPQSPVEVETAIEYVADVIRDAHEIGGWPIVMSEWGVTHGAYNERPRNIEPLADFMRGAWAKQNELGVMWSAWYNGDTNHLLQYSYPNFVLTRNGVPREMGKVYRSLPRHADTDPPPVEPEGEPPKVIDTYTSSWFAIDADWEGRVKFQKRMLE